MSKIALAPNASGTGTFTLSAPNSNTSRTLVLPDADGTLITNTSALDASKLTGNVSSALLTGALPAISGAALTGLASITPAAGVVGSYAFLRNKTTTERDQGETLSGSSLGFAGIRDTQSNNAGNMTNQVSPSGTWQCMGYVIASNQANTLWLRIS